MDIGDKCERDPHDADMFLGPVETRPNAIDVETLSKKKLDENGFISLPMEGASDSDAAHTVAP